MRCKLLTALVFICSSIRAQQINPVPDYVFSNRMSVGRSAVTDTLAYFSIGPRYGAIRGFMPPMVVDTALVTGGTKRNGLTIFSIQKNKYLYWDSVRVQWSDFAGSSGAYIFATDTASMLSPYIRAAGNGLTKSGQSLLVDTASIATRARVQKAVDSINANVALKVNISDTSSMLSPYTRGSGTTNYVPKFTGSRTLGNSVAYDNGGTELLVNTTTDNGPYALQVAGSIYSTTGAALAMSSGSVGIGNFPNRLLDVFGTFRTSGESTLPGWIFKTTKALEAIDTSSIIYFRRTGDNNPSFLFYPMSYQSLATLRLYNSGGSESSIWLSNGRLSFAGGSTENMTLIGSELFVGHSGAPTDAGAYALQVAGAIYNTTTITTGAPTSGSAKPWSLGEAATVSPTSPNRTIRVEIDGVVYYLHAKTTND